MTDRERVLEKAREVCASGVLHMDPEELLEDVANAPLEAEARGV